MSADAASDALALARRAAAPSGFRWVPGMREVESGALCVTVLEGRPLRWYIDGYLSRVEDEACFPDMGDAGTRGHYLELVREAWGDDGAHVKQMHGAGWAVVADMSNGEYFFGDTEDDALVCALEAAPR